MKNLKIQKQLNFIPNCEGIPCYDSVGKEIRKGIRAWKSNLETGIHPELLFEKLGNRKATPIQKGENTHHSKVVGHIAE